MNWKIQHYLTTRRVSRAATRVFGLGYFDLNEVSPFHERLMIPIRDPYGELLSFQGRAMFNYEEQGKPKYYHAPFDKGNVLYGVFENAEHVLDAPFVTIVEGPPDVWACYDAGLPAFGLMGTTFSQHQAYLVRRYARRALLWLDDDEAGDKAAGIVRKMLEPLGVECQQVERRRPFKDAGETWQKAGHDGMRRILHGRR